MKSSALNPPRAAARAMRPQTAKSVHHSVEIRPGRHVCPVVKRLAGKRFLSSQAPPLLPLGVCENAAQCECRYVHHDDRRNKARRRSDFGMPSVPPENV